MNNNSCILVLKATTTLGPITLECISAALENADTSPEEVMAALKCFQDRYRANAWAASQDQYIYCIDQLGISIHDIDADVLVEMVEDIYQMTADLIDKAE